MTEANSAALAKMRVLLKRFEPDTDEQLHYGTNLYYWIGLACTGDGEEAARLWELAFSELEDFERAVETSRRSARGTLPCVEPGCDRPANGGRGLCGRHYDQRIHAGTLPTSWKRLGNDGRVRHESAPPPVLKAKSNRVHMRTVASVPQGPTVGETERIFREFDELELLPAWMRLERLAARQRREGAA